MKVFRPFTGLLAACLMTIGSAHANPPTLLSSTAADTGVEDLNSDAAELTKGKQQEEVTNCKWRSCLKWMPRVRIVVLGSGVAFKVSIKGVLMKISSIVAILAVMTASFTSEVYAAAPSAIAANTGYAAGCYDFHNYIPAASSPVIGGALQLQSAGGFYMAPFGQVCSTGRGLVYARPAYASWVSGYPGYLAFYSNSYGSDAWYYAGPGSAYDSNCQCYVTVSEPAVDVACPWNTARIEASGYVRTDGGSITPNIINKDVGSSAGAAWQSPLVAPVSRARVYLCVKTDTTP